jgi:diguanylate cyclase (GGDEF)-like protein
MKCSVRKQDVPSLEWGQAKLRLLCGGFAIVFFTAVGLSGVTDIPQWRLAVLLAAGFFAASTAWAWWVRCHPGDFPRRRLAAALADSPMASIAIYLGGPLGLVFYPFLLQSVAGHTMRFGLQSLRVASTSGAIGFGVVILASEHWHEKPLVAVALWFGLLILPLYYHRLMRRLRDAKLALERELNKTVYAATHDPLTELANRGYFVQRLEDLIEGSRRSGERFALLYMDLDGFKLINDTLGHAAGDRVLVEVASVLRRCARRSDLAGRLGGDEFTLLVREVGDEEALDTLVRRLLIGIREVGRRLPGASALSASVGISLYPVHSADAGELLTAADRAMYRAKRDGKGRSCLVGIDHPHWGDQGLTIGACDAEGILRDRWRICSGMGGRNQWNTHSSRSSVNTGLLLQSRGSL